MKFKSFAAVVLLLTTPSFAQSVTELLQKGIFAQETAGDLDGAILIYRQIVNSASAQRDIAAQAQYRLTETLIRKGDLVTATQELQRLSLDYADQQALISRLAGRFQPQPVALQHSVTDPRLAEFDSNHPVTVSGEIAKVDWINPRVWIHVQDAGAAEWNIQLPSPNSLVGYGWTRVTLKQGDKITVNGLLAKDGTKIVFANTILFADGRKPFDRVESEAADATRQAEAKKELQKREEALRALGALPATQEAAPEK
jgi:hypothetical protein